MSKSSRPSTAKPRQVIGFSLSPAMASELKREAGGRNISLKKLLEEMWALYKKHGKAKA